MSGFRRLVSDYGFEGFFHEENIRRITKGLFSATAFGCFSFSSAAWYFRSCSGHSIDHFKDAVSYPCATEVSRDHIMYLVATIEQSLVANDISVDDLIFAAEHLKPVEIQLVEATSLLSSWATVKIEQSKFSDQLMRHILDSPCDSIRETALPLARVCDSITKFRAELLDALVKDWIRKRYLARNAVPDRSVFGHRETSEAVGVDIGSSGASALDVNTVEALAGLSLDHIYEATAAIQQWGFCLVRNAISETSVTELVKKFELDHGIASLIGERVIRKDANISHSRGIPNRLQMLIRGSDLEDWTRSIHAAVAPVVTSKALRRNEEVMLSDVRLVVVDHAADRGNWTMYNPRGGYTVMVPLQDRDCRLGSQTIIPASHFLADRGLWLFRRLLMMFERFSTVGSVFSVTDLYPDGCWRAGDAFVMDNRLLVCAEENKLFKSGTYLLVKYETPDVATGGFYWSGKILFRVARMFETLSRWTRPI